MITLEIVENNKPAVVVDVTKQVGAASYTDLLAIRTEVASSAQVAGESATQADQHRKAAEQFNLSAGNSATAAGDSATLAEQHKTTAQQGATTATEQASISTTKAGEATASAGAASSSEAKAQQWAEHAVNADIPGELPGTRSAKHHATKAGESATLADQRNTAAQQAASTATTKAGEAGDSANAASDSEAKAQQWADHQIDVDIPGELAGTRSAKHHATKAGESAILADQHRLAAGNSAQAASENSTFAGQHNATAQQAANTATEQASISTTKAGEASASAEAAGGSETKAQQWAEHTTGQDIPGQPVGSKSAKHWATEAQSLVETATGGGLLKEQNLADLPDKALARSNLSVPSKMEQANALALKLDAAGYTAADVLAKLLTVHGALSGLDADLYDGMQRADMEAALKLYTDNKVAGLVNTSPETLDTLNELAAALGNDPNFATTITNLVGTKLSSDDFIAAIGTMVQPYNSGTVVDPAYVHTDNNFTMPEKEKLARLVENPEVAAIRKPSITTPVSGDTGVLRATDILSTTYYSLYGVPHENSQVQVTSDNLFASIILDKITPGGVTSQRAEDLPHSTLLYAKVRYQDSDGIWSEWSDPVSFTTTTTYITAPTVVSPAGGAADVPEQPVIELSAFAVTGGTDTHAATSVRIKNAGGAVVWEQTETTPLNNIAVPAGVLQEGGLSYTSEPRYHGETYGASAWGEASSFTTAMSFIPAGSDIGKPYGGGYVAGEIVSDYDGERYLLIVSDGDGDSTLKDGSTHVWKSANTAVTTMGGTPPMTLADGRANHNALKAAGIANFPAAKWIEDNCNAGAGLNGHTDWYLPSRDELEVLYRAFKPDATANATSARYSSGFGGDGLTHGTNANSRPTGAAYTGVNPGQTSVDSFKAAGADAFTASFYWSSTEINASSAWNQTFGNGPQGAGNKTYAYRVRAVRRIKL